MKYVIAALCIAFAPAPGYTEEPRTVQDRLEGTWLAVGAEAEGEVEPKEQLQSPIRWIIRGKSLTIRGPYGVPEGATVDLIVDPTAEPKRLDWTGKVGGRQLDIEAIFRFDEGLLRVCAGQNRPASFKTAKGDGSGCIVFRRFDPDVDAALHALERRGALLKHQNGIVQHAIMENSNVRDADLVHLSALPELTLVNLKDTSVADSGLRHLKHLTKLTTLNLIGTKISGAGFQHLADLNALETLWAGGTSVGDPALESIGRMKRLKSLELSRTRISDEGLSKLKTLEHLTTLVVSGNDISDAGLEEVGSLRELTRLSLAEVPISDRGLEHLESLKDLSRLTLDGTQITDAALTHVGELRSLRSLSLTDCKNVDGSGFVHLAKLPQLTYLYLAGTEVTDQSVVLLGEVKSLEEVWVHDTKMSQAGVDALKQRLPECKVVVK